MHLLYFLHFEYREDNTSVAHYKILSLWYGAEKKQRGIIDVNITLLSFWAGVKNLVSIFFEIRHFVQRVVKGLPEKWQQPWVNIYIIA